MSAEPPGAVAPYTLRDGDVPLLHATRCPRDGVVAFPPERYGCRGCGLPADELDEITVPARGVVVGAVVVQRHRGSGPAAPFAIGDVQIDGGPQVRALVDLETGAGRRVSAAAITDAEGGEWLRFEPEGNQS